MGMTDKQWEIICSILPEYPIRPNKRGRPWTDLRSLLNGILWILLISLLKNPSQVKDSG